MFVCKYHSYIFNIETTYFSMRDLARQIVQGSIGIRIRVIHVSLQFSDKTMEKVIEDEI